MGENRRQVKSRGVQFFHQLAFKLVQWGFTPNQISVCSAIFAGLGALSLLTLPYASNFPLQLLALLGAFLGIQLRLICNLIDGLMAVEGGKKTAYGEFFNDFPDRLSDIFLILAAGYCIRSNQGPETTIAWAAALASVLTAYIRVLGSSMGAPHFFLGPMAKQHRMATLNLALLGTGLEIYLRGSYQTSLQAALVIILAATIVTCFRRTWAILKHFGYSGN